jgi:hypothetical protein
MHKKTTVSLKGVLIEAVRQQMVSVGFKLKAAKDKFIRRHNGITDQFQIVCLDAKPGYRIQPQVGVRVDRIEQIFHQTSEDSTLSA